MLLPFIALAIGQSPSQGDARIHFEKSVRPLLIVKCFSCHSSQLQRGGLRLDRREGLIKGGNSGPAVVPGHIDAGTLLAAVKRQGKVQMPPDHPLTNAEIRDLEQWIAAGAVWPDDSKPVSKAPLWSIAPIRKPSIPAVSPSLVCRTPIDNFIYARLALSGLSPARETDKATLLRRVTYDLTGLPPTQAETQSYLTDRSPNAYDKVVDRLLASPRYGERWGRHWLDAVHYGDTHGYDKDKRRDHAWPYRDYVIRAFNQDCSYPRFVQEQLAGDYLFGNTVDGVVATGFVTTGPWDFVGQAELREGTIDKEKTRVLDRDDMVSTAISTFCSLTVHCARCHDHKFDPITQQDYYRLAAVFSGVERGDRPYPDPGSAVLRSRLEGLLKEKQAELANTKSRIAGKETFHPEFASIRDTVIQFRGALDTAKITYGPPSRTNGYHSDIAPKERTNKWVQVDLGRELPIDTVRLFPARPIDFRDTPGFGFPIAFRVEASTTADFVKPTVIYTTGNKAFANPADEAVVLPGRGAIGRFVRLTAIRLFDRDGGFILALAELQVVSQGRLVSSGAPVTSLDSIEGGLWGRAFLVDGADSRRILPDLSNPLTAKTFEFRTGLNREIAQKEMRLTELRQTIAVEDRRQAEVLASSITDIEKELSQLLNSHKVYAVVSRQPRVVNLLSRGEVERPLGEMEPGTVTCLAGLHSVFPTSLPDGARRAALADWVVSPKNVLTWRSIVNRVWSLHFGKGIVDTPNDFGRMGGAPSHPELLDWLADDFRANPSFKRLHRIIVLSAAYRRASTDDPKALKVDADNRLLSRMNRRRLDAEEIRDTILTLSGAMNWTMGGPGFEPFRFKDDHSPIYDHTDLAASNRPDTWRRTVYRFVVRSVPHPFLESLDAADPNLVTPVRNTTLTSLQALAMLNDGFILDQARRFGARIASISDRAEERVAFACREALNRNPTPEECRLMVAYITNYGPANFARMLFNANAFAFID